MRSTDAVLKTYFVLRDGGMVSAVDPSNTGRSTAEPPPKWLVRQCEVGTALAQLEPAQRVAIVERWGIWLEADKHERQASIFEIRARNRRHDSAKHISGDQREYQRLRGRAGDYEWLAKERRRDVNRLRGRCRDLEDRQAYKDGMAALEEIFERRGVLTGEDPPAGMTDEQVEEFRREFARAVLKIMNCRKGAAVTNGKLTAEQRSANARKGAEARWGT